MAHKSLTQGPGTTESLNVIMKEDSSPGNLGDELCQ